MNLMTYEQLEQETLRLDDVGDEELADRLRTVMDFIWNDRLSPAERSKLNSRGDVKSEKCSPVMSTTQPHQFEAEEAKP